MVNRHWLVRKKALGNTRKEIEWNTTPCQVGREVRSISCVTWTRKTIRSLFLRQKQIIGIKWIYTLVVLSMEQVTYCIPVSGANSCMIGGSFHLTSRSRR